MIVLKKEYWADTLLDLEQDVVEMYDSRQFEEIPIDECGFHKGKFTVVITWEAEE
jgi:hypothetical protein